MIHRHRKLLGFTLWRWASLRWVLWLCPAGESIPTHTHHCMTASVRLLHGLMTWWKIAGRNRRTMLVAATEWRHSFTIPEDVPHGAFAHLPSVFLVRESWVGDPLPSVTCDLHEA
jgi:hypothetical protein